MFTRFRLGTAALLCAFLGTATIAQEKSRFELKLEKDKPFYQEMKTTVEQLIKVQGQDLTQKQETTFWFKWTPEKQEADKWVLKQKVEGLQMKIDISGNPIDYNSKNKDAVGGPTGNPGLMEFFRNLENAEFTVTVDKNFKVEKVEGAEAFIAKLGGGNQQMEGLLKKVLTPDALKEMADVSFKLVPDQAKAVNETWEKKSTMSLGPIGSYEVNYKFTYKGKDKDNKELDWIEVVTTLVYKAPTEAPEGLLFRIKSGDLKSEGNDVGKILYNPKTGRIEKADVKIKLKGKLTVTIGGTDTVVELDQTQTTSITTSDKSYMEKPPRRSNA